MSLLILTVSQIFLPYLEHREVDFGGIGLCQELREGRARAGWVGDSAEIIRAWIFKERLHNKLCLT